MSIETIPNRRAGGASPFLTAAAAARIADLAPATLTRRLVDGDMPAYRLGRRWFIPEAEFRRQLRRRAQMMQADAAADVVRELTAPLPRVLDIDDLERFFGLRRPFLFETLRVLSYAGMPVRSGIAGRGGITTTAVLSSILLDARNACVPCVAVASAGRRDVA